MNRQVEIGFRDVADSETRDITASDVERRAIDGAWDPGGQFDPRVGVTAP
jgi:hypothetical protein